MVAMLEFAQRRQQIYLLNLKNRVLATVVILVSAILLTLFYGQEWPFYIIAVTIFGLMFILIPLSFKENSEPNYYENKEFLNLTKGGVLCNFNWYHDEKQFLVEIFVPAGNMVFNKLGPINLITYTIRHFYAWAASYECYMGIYPIVPQTSVSKLSNDLDLILKNNLYATAVSLPNDIAEKAKDLSEVYLYLYVVENSLRMFIRDVAMRNFGSNYFPQLKITRDIQKSLAVRKENEEKNKWLSLRGSEELFYLDFKDLATVIGENWELFKGYFDSQPWIKTKIEELANIRNLVAHNNSFIDQHNKDVLRINYHQILKQIAKV